MVLHMRIFMMLIMHLTLTDACNPPSPAPAAPKCRKYDYSKVLKLSNLFYQAQRSGRLNAFNDFAYDWIPYRGDSALNDGSDNNIDLTGGYYDAGDFVKFNFPMAAATTLIAWGAIDFKDGYVAAGQHAQTLNMIKWATDYFIKCHPEPNVLYAQVGDGDADHAGWNRIEHMNIPRPSMKITADKPGSDLAGETAAALAAAYIVFNETDSAYANNLLRHAKELFEFADTYRGKYSDSLPKVAKFYKSWNGYEDELVWAAAWLYKATKDPFYLTKSTELHVDKTVNDLSWDTKTIVADILLAQLTGVSKYIRKVVEFCNNIVDKQERTPKGLVWIRKWASLTYASNMAFVCLEAARVEDPSVNATKFEKFALGQIHYALGDTGRSYVIGYGENPPKKPHHRSSSCPVNVHAKCSLLNFLSLGPNPNTLWGALVGGPGRNDEYADNRFDYVKNEVAISYNAGFQSAVAGLKSLEIKGILKGLTC